MKPVVDGLEAELDGRLTILRIDIQEDAGRQLAVLYQVQYTPTFIFFDPQGSELWRQIGGLDADRLRDSLK